MKSYILFAILSLAGLFFSFQYIGMQKYSIGIENGAEDFMLYNMKFYNKNTLTLLATGAYALIFILSLLALAKKRTLEKDVKLYFILVSIIMIATINHAFSMYKLFLAGALELLSTYYIVIGINLALSLLTLFCFKNPATSSFSNILDDNLSS